MDNCRILISFTYPHEAHLAKGYLDSNGIETFIENEFTVQANNFWSNAVGGVKLLVQESDYEQGLLVLKDGGYIKESSEKINKIEIVKVASNTNLNVCPFCKSENIGKNKKLNILMIPIYFLLGALIPVYRSSYICFDCEKEWRFKKQGRNESLSEKTN